MLTTMRAALLRQPGAPEQLEISETAVPDRVNAEFLVKVVASSVNPIDAKTRAGRGVFAAIRDFPAVLGHDFSGVVVQSPFAAHPIKPGDEVFGMVMVPRFSGTYAEYVSVPSLSVVRKPSTLSHIEAAGVPLAALTAWGMVVEVAKAHEGQRMLIHAGQRRRRPFRGAVRLLLRCPRDRHGIDAECAVAALARRHGADRLHEDALRGRRAAMSTSSSTWSATCTTTPAPVR